MTKRIIISLIMVGVLISAGGCTAIAVNALTCAAPLIFAATILNPDLDAPVKYEGGAWIMEPNEPLNRCKFKPDMSRFRQIENAIGCISTYNYNRLSAHHKIRPIPTTRIEFQQLKKLYLQIRN